METTPNRNSTGLVLKMVNLDLIFMGAENKVQQNHKKCKEQKENTHTHTYVLDTYIITITK